MSKKYIFAIMIIAFTVFSAIAAMTFLYGKAPTIDVVSAATVTQPPLVTAAPTVKKQLHPQHPPL